MKTVLAAFVSFVVMACPAFAEPITAVTEEMPPFNYTRDHRKSNRLCSTI